MTPPESEAPIACSLGPTAFKERREWIASLNRDGLQGHQRRGTSLELDYAAEVQGRVQELVRQEAACCAFLTFTIDHQAQGVHLTITVPEHAHDMADTLLAPFLPSAEGEIPAVGGS